MARNLGAHRSEEPVTEGRLHARAEAAILTHVRVKNPVFRMLPSSTLLMLSASVAWLNYRMPAG